MARKNTRGALLLCFVSVFVLQFLSYPCPAASKKSSFGKKFSGGLRKTSTGFSRAVKGVNKVVNGVNEVVETVNNVVDTVNTVGDSINQVFGNNGVANTCDPRGTLRSDGGQCVCKANVEGPLCDRCKDGYFYLSHDVTDGCLQCACDPIHSIHGSGCMTVKRTYSSMINLLEMGGQITDINEVPLGVPITKHNDDFYVEMRNGHREQFNTTVVTFPISGSRQSFWRVDLSGDAYLSSYGGYLFFDSFSVFPKDAEDELRGSKIVLVSSDGKRIANTNSYELTDSESKYPFRSWFKLVESDWHYVPENVQDMNDDYKKTPVFRDDMLYMLENLRSVMLRVAVFYPHQDGQFQLNYAEWPVSSLSDQGEESMLEGCQCDEGYDDPLCNYCAPGYSPSGMNADGDYTSCARNYSSGY